eukprot:NODE_136_length_16465_cov_1.184957.p4 type:complete len:593 gc:universal NODE_136_length_16465_cov_1.184957:16464-14686(-)
MNSIMDSSIYKEFHRYHSFAPIRQGSIHYFADSERYFLDLFNELENAKETIYICDWWLTPELYLLRPYKKHINSRIDYVLLRAAQRNVNIYILVFKEFNMALPNDSEHTKIYLSSLHRNIHVQRHPEHFASTGSLYWSHHEKLVLIDCKLAYCGGVDLCLGRFSTQHHYLLDFDDESEKLFPGQDYNNVRIKDFKQVRTKWDQDIISRDDPRMPWHDIHSKLQGESVLDIAFHFVQYWNHCKTNKTRRETIPFLTPPQQRQKLPVKGDYVSTQVLRSVSPWSVGTNMEKSILEAYIGLIRSAKKYVYIENQFFVSNASNSTVVKNTIAFEIVNRIKLAHEKGENFKVYVIIPLMPGFADLTGDEGNTTKLILEFQAKTISKGTGSILQTLAQSNINGDHYFCVFGLRNFAIKGAKCATEQIYIHSKLMIVDDCKCVLGSANINDRSMEGNRDSEIAVVSEFSENSYFKDVLKVENPILKLRQELWAEHLGEYDISLDDPSSDEAWEFWRIRSNINTDIYRTVFYPYPDDSMLLLSDLEKAGEFVIDVTDEIKEKLSGIKGHLVEYPLKFLMKEKHVTDTFSVERYAPGELFI